MRIIDRRTEDQKKTHTHMVVATGTFLIDLGECAQGTSYAAWACVEEDVDSVISAISNRNNMHSIRRVPPFADITKFLNGGIHDHLSIYVVD